MENTNLAKDIANLKKRSFAIKSDVNKPKTVTNLPAVRKVAIAKQRTKAIWLVALFVSCFSVSVFIGAYVPFLLFK